MNKIMISALATLILVIGAAFYYFYIKQQETFVIPFGLPPIEWPKDNPYSQKKADLGKLLYFDKRLSADGTISCASCHGIKMGFSDRNQFSKGIHNQTGSRHAPTIINAAYQKLFFWDGRARSLEEQAKAPIANPKEMSSTEIIHEAHLQCEGRVRSIAGYRTLFKEVFGNDDCTIDNIAKAIATFERTVLSGNAPYDRYIAGDISAMTQEQIQGLKVFKRVGCNNCHYEFNFTDGRFLNIGVGMDAPNPDLGRYLISHNERDWGAFKVPTLREIEKTYPYMHDGSLKTLEDVVDYYDRGGIPNKNLQFLMRPLNLSDQDKKALVSFMKALSGEGWEHFEEPEKFPE